MCKEFVRSERIVALVVVESIEARVVIKRVCDAMIRNRAPRCDVYKTLAQQAHLASRALMVWGIKLNRVLIP
jgi:hypothetical protein